MKTQLTPSLKARFLEVSKGGRSMLLCICMFASGLLGMTGYVLVAPPARVQFFPLETTHTNYVSISAASPDGIVKYTLDGTEPTLMSKAFRDPIYVTASTLIKAKAFPRSGMAKLLSRSKIHEKHYSIVNRPFRELHGSCPVMILRVDGTNSPDAMRVPVSVALGTNRTNSFDESFYQWTNHYATYWTRGSSSRTFRKRSYRLELRGEMGMEQKAPLLGLPAESDWVLYSSYADRSFIRDVLMFELWRKLGYYAPRWRYVHLFITSDLSTLRKTLETHGDSATFSIQSGAALSSPGMRDYQGLYILVEKIKRGPHRVDIERLHYGDDIEPLISGGYMFKYDRANDSEKGFVTSQNVKFAYEDPKESSISEAQKAWLAGYINEYESALNSIKSEGDAQSYRQYVDIGSFIDYHWFVELGRNIDGYLLSIHLFKDREKPMCIGPIWDWNMSLANTAAQRANHAYGWGWKMVNSPFYNWYKNMFEDPDFLQQYVDRWYQLKRSILKVEALEEQIASIENPILEARKADGRRWGTDRLFRRGQLAGYPVDDLDSQRIRKWFRARIKWIDEQGFPPPEVVRVTHLASDLVLVELGGEGGSLMYTSDGQDPRTQGGQIAGSSKRYQGGILCRGSEFLTARILSRHGLWSAPLMLNLKDVPMLLTKIEE